MDYCAVLVPLKYRYCAIDSPHLIKNTILFFISAFSSNFIVFYIVSLFNFGLPLPVLNASNGLFIIKLQFVCHHTVRDLACLIVFWYCLIRSAVWSQAVCVLLWKRALFFLLSLRWEFSLEMEESGYAFQRHLCSLIVWRQTCVSFRASPSEHDLLQCSLYQY